MKVIVPLTDSKIKNAKPKEKPYKLSDGGGLTLVIRPGGVKNWVLRIRSKNKETNKSLGNYPAIPLKEARLKARNIKEEIKEVKTTSETLEAISYDYFYFKKELSDYYVKDSINKLDNHIFPYIGSMPIDEITLDDLVNCFARLNKLDLQPTGIKIFGTMQRIYRYAVTNKKAKHNIISDLDKSLLISRKEKTNFKHTTDPKVLSSLLKSIDEYDGFISTKTCLQILPYVFVRPINIVQMKWDDICFDKKVWIVDKSEMKTKRDFVIPLCPTVIEKLSYLKSLCFGGKFVFKSQLSIDKHISRDSLAKALKRMDFDLTAHGFRHTASTLLNENKRVHGLDSDIIELQLAHAVGGVKGIYDKSQNLDDRFELMIWWGAYLDSLKKS